MTLTSYHKIIPVLKTERLILRGHKPSDFPEFAAMRADPEVARYTTGKPIDEEEAWSKFLTCLGLWANLGYGYWAIADKKSDRYIGEAGFGDFKRDIKPSIRGVPEAGWVLTSKVHGKGYGSEAVEAILSWADQNFSDPRTVCIVDGGNPASVKLALKNGYSEFARADLEGEEVILMERYAPK